MLHLRLGLDVLPRGNLHVSTALDNTSEADSERVNVDRRGAKPRHEPLVRAHCLEGKATA